ncbi:MAG: TetR/AcrR family transcriptional regulator [Nocardioidaceae bacterium]
MSEPATDGRRARGERTRLALLEATLDVVARDGVAGVTHRSVTRQAGVPATSAAYHFPSIDHLLDAALSWADQQNSSALASIADSADPVADLARWLVDVMCHERARCLGEYELYLHAAREPAFRPAATRWLEDLHSLVGGLTTSPRAVGIVCAYVDGLLIQAQVTGATPDPAEVEASIRSVLDAS